LPPTMPGDCVPSSDARAPTNTAAISKSGRNARSSQGSWRDAS
jgi:hypothetical protein